MNTAKPMPGSIGSDSIDLREWRYKACLIHSEQYLLTCMRYIELNPVCAGMLERSATNKCWVLGDAEFKQSLTKQFA